jgi:hypothetical protein
MSPGVRDEWEKYLGLKHQIMKGKPERETPSIRIQRTMFAFGDNLLSQRSKNPRVNDKSLKVSERATSAYGRFTHLHLAFHEQANSFPGLLTAFNSTPSPTPPPILAKRMTDDSIHQLPPAHTANQHPTESERQGEEKRKDTTFHSSGQLNNSNIGEPAAEEPNQSQTMSGKRHKTNAALDLSKTKHPAEKKKKHRKKQRKVTLATKQKDVAKSVRQGNAISPEQEERHSQQQDDNVDPIEE